MERIVSFLQKGKNNPGEKWLQKTVRTAGGGEINVEILRISAAHKLKWNSVHKGIIRVNTGYDQ
jgi:hypothetical protein